MVFRVQPFEKEVCWRDVQFDRLSLVQYAAVSGLSRNSELRRLADD